VTKTPCRKAIRCCGGKYHGADQPTVKTSCGAGTFSVGRLELPTMADALENRLGAVCHGFDVSAQPRREDAYVGSQNDQERTA